LAQIGFSRPFAFYFVDSVSDRLSDKLGTLPLGGRRTTIHCSERWFIELDQYRRHDICTISSVDINRHPPLRHVPNQRVPLRAQRHSIPPQRSDRDQAADLPQRRGEPKDTAHHSSAAGHFQGSLQETEIYVR